MKRPKINGWRHCMVAVMLMLGLAASLPAIAAISPVSADDMSMGDPHARVTVIEYGSASCPHCAHFNNDVFPAFKAKYIDSGRVRYVFREFLTPPAELAAAGFLLARCGGRDKYFSTLDEFFHAQASIYQSEDPSLILMKIAKDAGLSDDQAKACLSDQTAVNALNARVDGYMKNDKIDGTPTFIINGQRFTGDDTLEALAGAVDHAEAAAHPSRRRHLAALH